MKVTSQNSRKRINFDVVPINVKCKKRKMSVSSSDLSTDSSTINKASTSRSKKGKLDSSIPNVVKMDYQATPKCRPKMDYHEIDNILSECETEMKHKTGKLNQSKMVKASKAPRKSKLTIIKTLDSDVNSDENDQGSMKIMLGKNMQTSIASSKNLASKNKSNKNKREDFQNLLKIIENDFTKEEQKSDKSTSKRKRAISINEITDSLAEDIVGDNPKRYNKDNNADALMQTDSEELMKGKKKKKVKKINIIDVVTVKQKDLSTKKSVNPKEQDDGDILIIKESSGSMRETNNANQVCTSILDRSPSFDNISDKFQELIPSLTQKVEDENPKSIIKKSSKKKAKHENVINLDLLTKGLKLDKEKLCIDTQKSEKKKKSKRDPKVQVNRLLKSPIDQEIVCVDSNILVKKVNLTKTKVNKKSKKKQMDNEELNVLDSIYQKKGVEAAIRSLNESMNIKNESINEHNLHHEWIIKESPDTSLTDTDSEHYINNKDEQLQFIRSAHGDPNQSKRNDIMKDINIDESNQETNFENITGTVIDKEADTKSISKDVEKFISMTDHYPEKLTKRAVSLCSPNEFKTLSDGESIPQNDSILSKQIENKLPSKAYKRKSSECKVNEVEDIQKPRTLETTYNNTAVERQLPKNDLNISFSDDDIDSSLVINNFNRKSYLNTKKPRISLPRHDDVINTKFNLNKPMSSSIHFDPINDAAHTSTQNTKLDVLSNIKIDSAKPGTSVKDKVDQMSDEDEETNDGFKEMLKIETTTNEVLPVPKVNEKVAKNKNHSKLDTKYSELDSIFDDCVLSLNKCRAEQATEQKNSNKKFVYLGRQDLSRVQKYLQDNLVKNVERGCKSKHNKNISFDTQQMITEAIRMAMLKRDWDSIPYLLSHAIEMGNSYFTKYISETLMTYLMVRKNEGDNEELLKECCKLMSRKLTDKDKISELNK